MTLIFETGPLSTPDGGVDFERIREIVASCLGELPRLRSKLRRVPGDGHPVWVDDAEFNLDYHLRHSSLPRPGNVPQLCRTTARIAAGRLDRSRPLWDCWVVEGLEGGRFALIIKMHKALAAASGADLIRSLLSPDEERFTASRSRYRPRPAPSPVELFAQEVLRNWSPSRRWLSRGLHLATHPGKAGQALRGRGRDMLRILGYAIRPSTESPFDGRLGPHRTFEMLEVSLDELQSVRRAIGGSLHDLLLALLTGALRRFVQTRLTNPVTVDLRAVTPVLDAEGRHARAWVIELPLWEADPVERIRLVREQTRRIRSEENVASGERMASASEWNGSELFSIGARAVPSLEHGQIIVLKAPGPRNPLYLDGARLEACYGTLPLQDSCGLGVTALSYTGRLFLAFNADPEIVPDLEELRRCIPEEVAALVAAASSQPRKLRAVSA